MLWVTMKKEIINFILIALLIVFPAFLSWQLYFLDKVSFFCPIKYGDNVIVIRNDRYGRGSFNTHRSGNRSHNGLDLQAAIGTPVYAVRSGRVLKSEFHRGLGNYVEILHPDGYISIYGHLSRLDAARNEFVRQADKIGEVGKTGNANYADMIAHLHFEIRKQGIPVDPGNFMALPCGGNEYENQHPK